MSISPRETRLTLTALMVVFMLGALDQTIVSTALPRIIEQLRGLERYGWVGTAYLLSSTVTVPIYGKLGDLYGRKGVLLTGISIFLAGSALCGLAGEFGTLPLLGDGMNQLIVFRTLQGIGGGALFSSAFAIIADLFPPQQRGRFMGLFGGVFGLASILGPTIGGFFTDHGSVSLLGYDIAGWRWVFYVNLPIGLIALLLIATRMPLLAHRPGGKVDYLGAVLLVAAFVPLLLALSWGGNRYAWNSPQELALAGFACVALLAFLFAQSRTPDAIVPLRLFRSRAFSITNSAAFLMGMSFFGVVMFMPLYMQVVQGVDATRSGFAMLPLMAGVIAASAGSGQYVSRSGRYKPVMVAGAVTLLIGVSCLSFIDANTTVLDLDWRLLLVGLGLGPTQSLYSMVSQNAVAAGDIGVATSTSQFARQIGAAIGVAIFGTLLTHNLRVELPRQLPPLAGATGLQQLDLGHAQASAMNPQRIRDDIERVLPAGTANRPALVAAATAQTLHGLRAAFAQAITSMFRTSLLIIGMGLVLTCLIPALPLRRRTPAQERAAAA
jgi:EmrB/QacA subfamily drug resistance transporter